MAGPNPVSAKAQVAGVIFLLLAVLSGFAAIVGHSDMGHSDAAGNGMEKAFATLFLFALYFNLGMLALIAAIGGATDGLGKALLPGLALAGFLISLAASDLLQSPGPARDQWPLAILAAAPVPIVWMSLRALFPALQRPSDAAAQGLAVAVMAGLAAALAPLETARTAAYERLEQHEAAFETAFASLPADAPLWDLLRYVSSDVYDVNQKAVERIKASPRRQADAEAMLDRDELPFAALNQYDFDPTPALCEKARASLTRRAAEVAARPRTPGNDAAARAEIDSAHSGLRWLVGMNCPCDEAAKLWEDIARARGVDDYTLKEMVDLRDPRELGWTLFTDPPHFSMLTPKSKLIAWVKFATEPGHPAEEARAAMEGARKLDHRTADAVEWLTDPRIEGNRFELMSVWRDLDLEATPALCAAALTYVRKGLAEAYHPTASDPLPYSQMNERFGIDQPLDRTFWLAEHGCDADAALSDAAALVQAFQDGPGKAEMLARIASLWRKP